MTHTANPTAGPWADLPPRAFHALSFDVGSYFRDAGVDTFFDVITVRFRLPGARSRCHVPLLVGPWSYTTYRGS